MSEATALPTEPQPRPLFFCSKASWRVFWGFSKFRWMKRWPNFPSRKTNSSTFQIPFRSPERHSRPGTNRKNKRSLPANSDADNCDNGCRVSCRVFLSWKETVKTSQRRHSNVKKPPSLFISRGALNRNEKIRSCLNSTKARKQFFNLYRRSFLTYCTLKEIDEGPWGWYFKILLACIFTCNVSTKTAVMSNASISEDAIVNYY